jgi:hypothetical protein
MTKYAVALLWVVAIGACNPQKEARNKECGEFAAWSNTTGAPLAKAVPDVEKSAADTNEKRAAMYRKLAEGARQSAKTTVPFKDPHVKDLATRHLAVFEEIAVALDRQADAWQKGDSAASTKALQEEMDAKAKHNAISTEWLKGCRI